MKKLFFWGLLVLSYLQIHAQTFQVTGKVTDENLPLEGVSVYPKGKTLGTTTNEDGEYQLNLPQGKYILVFAFGNKKEVRLTLTEDQEVDVNLAEAISNLEDVIVRSVRVDADSPITHSNLTKEEIRERNLGQDIPILMQYMPSVVSTSDAGNGVGYTGIRVRGSDASRVNVTLNGIPYNDQESQGTFWVNLPDFASSVENLQLQRGVGTSTNGSGAFGASLNIQTDEVSEEAYAEIGNSFGSFNTRRHNVKFSTGLMNEHFEVSGRLSTINSDGYIDRAFSDLKSYFLQGAYQDENRLIKAIAFGGHNITYQAWFGIDEATLKENRRFNPAGQYTDLNGNTRFYDNEIDDYKQDHFQLHWNEKINRYWSTNLGLNYTYGRGYFEQFRPEADMIFHGLLPQNTSEENTTTDLIRQRWLDNDYYVINANINYQDNEWDITTGAFYSYYTNNHFGKVIWARNTGLAEPSDLYYDGNGTKREFTTFSKATYRVNNQFSVYGDVQYRYVNYQTSGITSSLENLLIDQDFNFFNPKAGLTYQLDKNFQMYSSYGRAHREPRRTDFEEGINDAERLDDFELGWRYESKLANFNVNLFYMLYENQMVLTGELDDVGRPVRETSGESFRRGIEIDAEVRIGQFTIRPNLSWSSNKNRNFSTETDGELVNLGRTNISFSPNLVAGNMLMWNPKENVQIGFLSKYVGAQYMGNIDSSTSKLSSFFVNDLNLVYEIREVGFVKKIVFNALINNIFNKKFVSNGYFFRYDDTWSEPGETTTIEGAGFYPQAGRNFLIGSTLIF
ncbi:MAG: TonB-dependent receptor [Psychroflexus maritimus]